MSERDDFERDLRDTLDDLGRAPAPKQLIARVRAMPVREPAPRATRLAAARRLTGWAGLAAAAVIVALVFGASFLAPRTGPASTSTSTVEPSELVGPVLSPAASPLPSPATPNAGPTSAPSTTPSPTPEPAIVAGGRVPSGFEPLSVTFASPGQGWVLGTYPCAGSSCALVVHTADAGRTWTVRGKPPVEAGKSTSGGEGAPVQTIRFADAQHGWMYGSQLWVTSDGGATWQQSSVPGFSSARVYALEAARGTVHAVGPGQDGFVIATSAVGSTSWKLSPTTLQVGAGPVPSIQLVLSGGGGWILQNDRTTVDGARYSNGWSTWTPPCASTIGPAFLAASSRQNVVAVCDVGLWATPQGIHLYVSTDAGTSFGPVGPALPLQNVEGVTTPGPSTIIAAGSTSRPGSVLVASFDGGRHWSTALVTAAESIGDLGFTTTTQGVAIGLSGNGSSALYMTRDGGHTWAEVAL